jgi:hypothetical protein
MKNQKYNMDCFIQDLLRDKLLSIEENNSDNDNDNDNDSNSNSNSNSDEFVDSIDDDDSDCWKKIIVITAPNNTDVGTGAASTSLHRRRRRLFVAIVSDNSRVFSQKRPDGFRRMEDIKKQKDQWDANHHGTNNDSNNNNNNNNNKDELKREMSDLRLLVAKNTCRKQHHRDFRREMSDSMLLVPKRRCSDLTIMGLAIINKKKQEYEVHKNGSNNNKYKQRDFRREMSDLMLVTSKRRYSNLRKGLATVNIEQDEDDDEYEGHSYVSDNDIYKHRDFRREMSDSMLVTSKRRYSNLNKGLTITKEEDEWYNNGRHNHRYRHRDFRRETSDSMLVTSKRRYSDLNKGLTITKEEDEWYNNGRHNHRYKHRDFRREMSDSMLVTSKRRYSDLNCMLS